MVAGLFTTSLLSLLLPITALAGPHGSGPLVNRHYNLARRAEGNVQLYQRGGGARLSFYDAQTGNAGSCGSMLSNSGYTVAMNQAQMQPSLCYKPIIITYNGRSTTAVIADTCPGCPPNGLDLTEGLFKFFAPAAAGIIYGEWHFAGDAPSVPPPPPPPPPPPRPTLPPPPPPPPPPPTFSLSLPPLSLSLPFTSAWQSQSNTPTTTKSSVSPTSTHNSTATLTSSSSSAATPSVSINLSSGAASGLAVPTGTAGVNPGAGDNIENLYQAYIGIGAVLVAAQNV